MVLPIIINKELAKLGQNYKACGGHIYSFF